MREKENDRRSNKFGDLKLTLYSTFLALLQDEITLQSLQLD